MGAAVLLLPRDVCCEQLINIKMGHVFSQYLGYVTTRPDYTKEPTFDPLYGYPEGRKERVMVATQEEMEKAKLALRIVITVPIYLSIIETADKMFGHLHTSVHMRSMSISIASMMIMFCA